MANTPIKILLTSISILLLAGFFLINLGKKSESIVDIIFIHTTEDADSILIKHNNTNILIDTGTKHDSKNIISTLKDYKIQKLDYIILTHPDKDHIGGASEILDIFPVENIIYPDFYKDTKTQNQLIEKITALNINTIIPTEKLIYNIEDINITIFPTKIADSDKSNNHSLITHIQHKNIDMLFMGDSESKRLKEALQYNIPNIDLYKVPHHGRANKTSSEFIYKIQPKFSVITSNSADKEVLNALSATNSQIFFTVDQEGSKTCFTSNGNELTYIS